MIRTSKTVCLQFIIIDNHLLSHMKEPENRALKLELFSLMRGIFNSFESIQWFICDLVFFVLLSGVLDQFKYLPENIYHSDVNFCASLLVQKNFLNYWTDNIGSIYFLRKWTPNVNIFIECRSIILEWRKGFSWEAQNLLKRHIGLIN